MSVKFTSNCQLAIHVPDISKAEEFYSGIPGFKLLSRSDEMLEYDTGSLMLYIKQDKEMLISFIPSLDVKDLNEAKESLKSKGFEIFNESDEGFYFKDTFGFVIDVIERK